MSLIDSELQGGLREMEASQADDGVSPSFIDWNGISWPCSKDTNKAGNAYESGGKVIIYDFAIRVRLDAFDITGATSWASAMAGIKPKDWAGKKITYSGTVYTVAFSDTAHGAFLKFLLTFDAI